MVGGREGGRDGGVVEGKSGVEVVKEEGEGGKEKGREAGVDSEVEEGREAETERSAEVEIEVEVKSASRGREAGVVVEAGSRDTLASDSDRTGAASVTTVLPFT